MAAPKTPDGKPIYSLEKIDTSVKRRFGNITTASTNEVLASGRTYIEQTSQAQRSVKSTSASDASPNGVGARAVRITYLDSNYQPFYEDILLNGTNAVNTVATNIRFIESMEVIRGTSAVGAIQLMTATAGGGSEFCGIGSGTTNAFLPHHYVPDGYTCYVLGWGGTTDDETTLKLVGQSLFDGYLVDPNIVDIEKLFDAGAVIPARLGFERFFLGGVKLDIKTRIRITTTPNQNTSTVTRTWMYYFEE